MIQRVGNPLLGISVLMLFSVLSTPALSLECIACDERIANATTCVDSVQLNCSTALDQPDVTQHVCFTRLTEFSSGRPSLVESGCKLRNEFNQLNFCSVTNSTSTGTNQRITLCNCNIFDYCNKTNPLRYSFSALIMLQLLLLKIICH